VTVLDIKTEVNNLEKIILPFINEYFEKYDLSKLYLWEKFKLNTKLFTNDEIQLLNNLKSLEKNVELKHIINKKLKNNSDNNDLHIWIIKTWGGIRSFKKYKDINIFLKSLENKKIEFPDRISSFSKIASFKYLNEFFIYDAHVSYALNWILIKHGDFNIKYFPFKFGQNKSISEKFNLKTVLTLINKDIEYYNDEIFYFIYCELINSIFKNIKNNKIKEPFFIEMMLFSLLENIIKEIKEKVKISIK